ncbi:unnamed protein product [Symbiodinium pilosum]|uniref:Uncharacterized protein n=1 Tax=Symbiodinium pilosum TaxID=2952 RepID=A0A812TGC4_SYMPI|nr:unnamed protein product [Symbiodinium pilosum]
MPIPAIPSPGDTESNFESNNHPGDVRSIAIEVTPHANLHEVEDVQKMDFVSSKGSSTPRSKGCSGITARLGTIEKQLGLSNAHDAKLDSNHPTRSGSAVTSRESVGSVASVGSVGTTRTEGRTTPVTFEESAWNIPLVLGLADVGWFDTVFAVLLVLLNLVMQGSFSVILLSEYFMGEPFDTKVQSAKDWRTSIAHDSRYLDLAGTSLVSRVCAGDGSLILSTVQATLIEHINDFLGLQPEEFAMNVWQPGTLLCMLCILLWSLCVYKEFRKIWHALEAATHIAKASETDFRDNTIFTLSWGRALALLITYIIRLGIASVLLVAGILWLARTTSIEELMLNAVALNAILDVDEFLFAGMTPIKIQHAIQDLEPIKVSYSHRRSQTESMFQLIAVTVTALTAYMFLLVPLGDTMLTVKRELCDGQRDFVVSYSTDTQISYGLTTQDLEAVRGSYDMSPIERAVMAHKGTPSSLLKDYPRTIYFLPDKRAFNAEIDRTLLEFGMQWSFCMEVAILQETGRFHGDRALMPIMENFLRNAATALGRLDARTCGQLADLCGRPDARLLRTICGDTCACTSPVSNPWYKVEEQGCAKPCLEFAERTLENRSCQDVPANDEAWRDFWNHYADALVGFYGQGVTQTALYAKVACQATAQPAAPATATSLLFEPQDVQVVFRQCEKLKISMRLCFTNCMVVSRASKRPDADFQKLSFIVPMSDEDLYVQMQEQHQLRADEKKGWGDFDTESNFESNLDPVEDELRQLQRQFDAEILRITARLGTIEKQLGLSNAHDAKPEELNHPTRSGSAVTGRESVGSAGTTRTEGRTTPVTFEESAWNIPLVLGLADVGWFDTVFAVLLVLLNLVMQGSFSVILLSESRLFRGVFGFASGLPYEDQEITISRGILHGRTLRHQGAERKGLAHKHLGRQAFFTFALEALSQTETGIAHDARYLDLAGTSLVSRVCAGDGSLILSTVQATLIEHINDFLGLQPEEFAMNVWQPGTLLCMLCILLWSLCVYKASETDFRDSTIFTLSWGRALALLITYIIRAGIASVLLVAGILWLARTTSIEELMLNAVALNAILDVDEFLFAGMTPIKIQHAIQDLEPIKVSYSHRRSQIESMVQLLAVMATVLTAYLFLLVPLGDTMLTVKRELCDGQRDFVVSYSTETQISFGLDTQDLEVVRSTYDLSPVERAVMSHKGTPSSTPNFEKPPLASEGMEVMVLEETGQLHQDPALQPIVETILRNAATALGRPTATTCAELADLCGRPDARLLRITCGTTCGCTSPVSNPWYKVEEQGCARPCLEWAELALPNVSCQDVPASDQAWRDFWNHYADALIGFYGQGVTQTAFFFGVADTVRGFLTFGCPFMDTVPTELLTNSPWCTGRPDLFRPLASLCPVQCGCRNDSPTTLANGLPSYCPASCAGNSSSTLL